MGRYEWDAGQQQDVWVEDDAPMILPPAPYDPRNDPASAEYIMYSQATGQLSYPDAPAPQPPPNVNVVSPPLTQVATLPVTPAPSGVVATDTVVWVGVALAVVVIVALLWWRR